MPQHSLACTLFDGDYHLGVGALINSLHKRHFSGSVCAGYRGPLPFWAAGRVEPGPAGSQRMKLEKFDVLFFPLSTRQNLAYYKPVFMMDVWRALGATADYIYFFDADIFILAEWDFFERWADAGVALVSDGNTPMAQNHPLRVQWRNFCEPHGFRFAGKYDYHYNSGFSGFSRSRVAALEAWEKIYILVGKQVDLSLPISLPGAPEWQRKRTFPFYLPDQDALNTMANLEGVDVSPIGPEGMGWKQPLDYMHHACFGPKPWRRGYLRRAFKGSGPSSCDYAFWQHVDAPLRLFTSSDRKNVRLHMAIGRRLAALFSLVGN